MATLIKGFTYSGSATFIGDTETALGGSLNIYAVAQNTATVTGAWGGATVTIEQCFSFDPLVYGTPGDTNVWIPLTKFVKVGAAAQGIGNATYTQNEQSWLFAPGQAVVYRARISDATEATINLWVYSANV